jgi:membrane-bound lytic murein transglycosylase B
MTGWFRRGSLLVLFLALIVSAPSPARGQAGAQQPHALITIYRIAPGKHLDFLKWMAETDAIAKEAGVPAGQFYAHTDGDSWDYLNVGPDLTNEQQAKVDEITKKRGRKTGFAASLEFRSNVASHTDTFVLGPVTAAELVAAGK